MLRKIVVLTLGVVEAGSNHGRSDPSLRAIGHRRVNELVSVWHPGSAKRESSARDQPRSAGSSRAVFMVQAGHRRSRQNQCIGRKRQRICCEVRNEFGWVKYLYLYCSQSKPNKDLTSQPCTVHCAYQKVRAMYYLQKPNSFIAGLLMTNKASLRDQHGATLEQRETASVDRLCGGRGASKRGRM